MNVGFYKSMFPMSIFCGKQQSAFCHMILPLTTRELIIKLLITKIRKEYLNLNPIYKTCLTIVFRLGWLIWEGM